MTLSVIIVNYNTAEITCNCLASLYKHLPQCETEIFVVDNNSSDNSVELISKKFPNVTLIKSSKNLGFSAGNNLALKRAKGDMLLLLNSDTIMHDDVLNHCISQLDAENTSILTCRLELKNGQLDLACRRSFPTIWNSFCRFSGLAKLFPHIKAFTGYNLTYKNEFGQYYIECLCGAFMLMKREVLENVGMLDEEFFMYGEDVDYCYRCYLGGYKIFYDGSVSITHLKKVSTKKTQKAKEAFYDSMWLYYKKHFYNQKPKIVNLIVKLGIKIVKILGR